MTAPRQHCFVVAAHGRSPHIEACLASLLKQELRSPILISTSTPFDGIESIAHTFGAQISIHEPNRGIGADWNHALNATDSDLVTIAHQDDLYEPGFSRAAVAAHVGTPETALSFCNFGEIGETDARPLHTWNSRVKKLLVGSAYLGTDIVAGGWRRKLLLGFGNPILCPSVTIDRRIAPAFQFREDMRTNMDWLAWLELSDNHPVRRIPRTLVKRRVHAGSETARCIQDGTRLREDRLVFESLWPRPFAALLTAGYRLSYPGYSN